MFINRVLTTMAFRMVMKLKPGSQIDCVHLTGSAATYDAIVWQGQAKHGPSKHLPLKKPVYAELGNHTPYIIIPGSWNDADIEYHAESLVTGLTHNAGDNYKLQQAMGNSTIELWLIIGFLCRPQLLEAGGGCVESRLMHQL